MIVSIDILLIIVCALILVDIIVAWSLFFARAKTNIREANTKDQNKAFLNVASGKFLPAKTKLNPQNYLLMKNSVHLDKQEEDRIEKNINIEGIERKYLRRLNSRREVAKAEAIFSLGRLGSEQSRLGLEKQLLKEKNFALKLYIANALSDIRNKDSIPIMVYSLMNASRFYRTRVNMLICDFGKDLHDLLPWLKIYDRFEIRELLVDFSSVYFSEELKDYLLESILKYEDGIGKPDMSDKQYNEKVCANCINGQILADPGKRMCQYKGLVDSDFSCRRYKILPISINKEEAYRGLVYKACNTVADYYPKELNDKRYLESADVEIRRIAMRGFSNFRAPSNMNVLLSNIKDKSISQSAANAISLIVERDPAQIPIVVDAFLNENEPQIKKVLAQILSMRLEYFIARLTGGKREESIKIIEEVVFAGNTSEITDFLNKNKNAQLEEELTAIVCKAVQVRPELKNEFGGYLIERLAFRCGIAPKAETKDPAPPQKDKKFKATLGLLILINLLLVPSIFLIGHWNILGELSFTGTLKLFVKDFNYYFIYYSIAINIVYFTLLLLSFIHVGKQKRMWQTKDLSFLFKKKMLPTISIVAPAYNESKTIIENVNSLLNLQYPEYELIVVNDGSSDKTLQLLIKEFGLKKVDRLYDKELNTRPVRGIYVNRQRPKLIIVDKVNGGKADSLNAGINIASNEYICSIDSDSILEEDALLKLVSRILDEDVETPAMGGNVLPINGCKVERGVVQDIRIPKNNLAKFQTVEYIRAFMSGRLGWSFTNNLLIISGAFGLFRKERGISVGGYLTSSGEYGKDTVGEDMEIVVRIIRRMREMGHKYKIRYAFNANCWTEVPEDLKTLKRQRHRWQLGLLEIMYFHKAMVFNPRYGSTGLVAMPYYFIFEVMGPIFEVQGYFAILLGWLLGILNADIALLLFVSVVLTGTLISIASLLIIEQSGKMFTVKDIFHLVICAVVENFGVRQYMSLLRVGAYIRIFRSAVVWDKAERKGFSPASENFKGGSN